MRRGIDSLNALGLSLALGLAGFGGSYSTGRGLPKIQSGGPELTSAIEPVKMPGGSLALRDAGGELVPLVRYGRIVSGTMIADRVLSDLCEPDRIVAFTEHGASSRVRHRYVGKPSLAGRASVEAVLALHPDLLIVNNLVDPGYVARLREHGVRVFDLGHMRGIDTLLPNIRAIGWLISAPERAEAYARALENRLARVAEPRPRDQKPRALYLSVYGDRLYGGAARTSYHDVIEYAGLRDAAAEAELDGWPELTAERLLGIDPQVLVTKRGMARILCRRAGLERLRPCRGEGRVVEIDGALLDDPGPTILDAAEALHHAYFGAPTP